MASKSVILRLQSLLDSLVRRKHIHHAIMAVERGDGSFRWTGAAGTDPEGNPVSPDSPFFIASITKLHIATVTLKLMERGSVRLDEGITEYLPDSLTEKLHVLNGVDHSAGITVRHLLAHATGLPDYLEVSPKGGRSLAERLTEEGDISLTIEDVVRIVRDDLTPHFPPQLLGATRHRARYSDTNYQLLIAIIEAVTGGSVQEAFTELLYRPLGLRHTHHPGSEPLGPTPAPTTLWYRDRPLNIPRAMRCLGDLISTTDDLFTFMRALVSGEVFDDPATFALMHERMNRFGLPRDRAALRSPNWPIEYGLGLMRFRLPRLFAPFRPMPVVIGHTGSTGTWLFYCPDQDLLLAGTVDEMTAGAVPYRVVPTVLRLFRSRSRIP